MRKKIDIEIEKKNSVNKNVAICYRSKKAFE